MQPGDNRTNLDDYYDRAIELAKENGFLSGNLLQREFKIGSTVAARLMDKLEFNKVLVKRGNRRVYERK